MLFSRSYARCFMLSVSDIVVLHESGENSAHFVESVGFTGLPDFMRELEGVKEQEADKAENGLTDEEKQFLETDSAPLIAKKFLAWDEIEDLGYRFLRMGISTNSSRAKKHCTAMAWCRSLRYMI